MWVSELENLDVLSSFIVDNLEYDEQLGFTYLGLLMLKWNSPK